MSIFKVFAFGIKATSNVLIWPYSSIHRRSNADFLRRFITMVEMGIHYFARKNWVSLKRVKTVLQLSSQLLFKFSCKFLKMLHIS